MKKKEEELRNKEKGCLSTSQPVYTKACTQKEKTPNRTNVLRIATHHQLYSDTKVHKCSKKKK
jgi:hypothetical protein